MLGVFVRLLRRFAAACHGLRGRLAFRFGRTRAARRHFERVLSLGGDEFLAYLYLGRIALGEGDFAGYRREMGNARVCDPERFARLRPAVDGLEPRTAGTPFEETGERATWRTVRPGSQSLTRRSPVHWAEVPTEGPEDVSRTLPQYELPRMDLDPRPMRRAVRDDFCSTHERDRFRRMPPIRREDLRGVDVDEIARRLGG